MILPDFMIREQVLGAHVFMTAQAMAIYGEISDEQIQPASLDVRLGSGFRSPRGGWFREYEPGQRFLLDPGECVLAHVAERFALPFDLVARIEGKSSWARKFLTVHSAGFIDPGFRGDVTLELKNDSDSPLVLPVGAVIAQVSFHQMAAPALRPYGHRELNSHYQGQSGATRSAL